MCVFIIILQYDFDSYLLVHVLIYFKNQIFFIYLVYNFCYLSFI